MEVSNNYYIWNRGEFTKLSADFSNLEFECRCHFPTCKVQKINKSLVEILQSMRYKTMAHIVINSAFRCAEKQRELSILGYETAKGVSQHELGNAADIACATCPSSQLGQLSRQNGIKAVGVAKTFIHVDMRADRDREWTYTKSIPTKKEVV